MVNIKLQNDDFMPIFKIATKIGTKKWIQMTERGIVVIIIPKKCYQNRYQNVTTNDVVLQKIHIIDTSEHSWPQKST